MSTIPPSTVDAVRDYLFLAMQTQLQGADIGVFYGEPSPGYPDDMIILGDVEQAYDPTQMVGDGGAGWLFENFHQHIEVSVFRSGDDPRAVFKRCFALVTQIEAIVRADPSLGGNVTMAYPAGTAYQSGWEESHMGRVTEALMRVHVAISRV